MGMTHVKIKKNDKYNLVENGFAVINLHSSLFFIVNISHEIHIG